MRQGKITQIECKSHMHKQERGSGAVIAIITDFDDDKMCAFYIDVRDKKGEPLLIDGGWPHKPTSDDNVMKIGDEIIFDKQSFLQKEVRWNGRKFRQRGYSYDPNDPRLYTG